MNPLIGILIVITAAYFVGEFCRIIKIPRVVGQVGIGIILGFPEIKQIFFPAQELKAIQVFANIGILLLFFFVGLEINIVQFKKNAKEGILVSLFNTSLPFASGFIASTLLGFSVPTSIIIGACLSMSAQAVAVDFLEEFGLLKSRIGRLIINAGAVDDIIELFLIGAVVTVINVAFLGAGLITLIAHVGLFTTIIVLLRFVIFPPIVERTEKEKSFVNLFTAGIILTLLLAVLADWLQIGALIGALFSGAILRQILIIRERKPWEEHNLAKAIHLVAFGFFVPIFFVWVGMATNIPTIIENINLGILFTIIAIVGTVGGTLIAVLMSKGTISEGWIVGWGLNAKGDVELVIAELAFSSSLIDIKIFSALIFMALMTTLISPLVLRTLLKNRKQQKADE